MEHGLAFTTKWNAGLNCGAWPCNLNRLELVDKLSDVHDDHQANRSREDPSYLHHDIAFEELDDCGVRLSN